MLTISKLERWSINYYIDTAQAAETAARDLARPGGGLGEYYSERENRTPVWLLAGNTDTVRQHRHRPATPTPSPGWSVSPTLGAPGETPTLSPSLVGSTTASHLTERMGGRSVKAVCTAST
jgi:hypothetical protein